MFYSGYSAPETFLQWPDAPVLSKPVDGKAIVDTVAGLMH
jgi:hypothetical protein